jgi:hypothetical protein
MFRIALLVAGLEAVVLSAITITRMLQAHDDSATWIPFVPFLWLLLGLRHWVALRLAHGVFYLSDTLETAQPTEFLVVALLTGLGGSALLTGYLFGWPDCLGFIPASVLAAILWVRAQSAVR